MDKEEWEFKAAEAELKLALKQIEEIEKDLPTEPPYCSFCGRGENQYNHCIEGKSKTKICDLCVFECVKLIEERKGEEEKDI